MRAALPILTLLLACFPFAAPAAGQLQRTGTLHAIWDGEPDGRPAFYFVDSDGEGLQLDVDPTLDAALLDLDRQHVVVLLGEVRRDDAAGPGTTLQSIHPAEDPLWSPRSMASVQRNFATLLCRYADEAPTFGLDDARVVHGDLYPGVAHYFAELSRDPTIMAGSEVYGWFDLPHPRETYAGESYLDLSRLTEDCLTMADSAVDFSAFSGVNLQFSGFLSRRDSPPGDYLSLGGSWPVRRDGTGVMGATWLSGHHSANRVVVVHEIGHALGWSHSSGKYGQEYDSSWDVMSAGYARWDEGWGSLPLHTIAFHKMRADWIPDTRRWQPGSGDGQLEIVRSALPPDHGFLMAYVPFDGGAYTVETRLHAGYDHPLPAEAIVIHETTETRAYVVDPDLDGDPNDAAASWLPGEEFFDQGRRISIAVDSATAQGFIVTITRDDGCVASGRAQPESGGTVVVTGRQLGPCGRSVALEATPAPGWLFVEWSNNGDQFSDVPVLAVRPEGDQAFVAHFVSIERMRSRLLSFLLGEFATFSPGEVRVLDAAGNGNGSLDLGDLAALLTMRS